MSPVEGEGAKSGRCRAVRAKTSELNVKASLFEIYLQLRDLSISLFHHDTPPIHQPLFCFAIEQKNTASIMR